MTYTPRTGNFEDGLKLMAFFDWVEQEIQIENDNQMMDVYNQISEIRKLRDRIHGKSMDYVNQIVNSNEGLEEAWVQCGSVAAFENYLEGEAVALESKIDEWIGDGILSALVGIKTRKLEYLEQSLPKLKEQLEKMDEKKVERKEKTWGFLWLIGRYTSRWLLNYNVFDKQANGFIQMCNVVSSLNSADAVDVQKLLTPLAGTPYMNAINVMLSDNNAVAKEVKTTSWLNTLVRNGGKIIKVAKLLEIPFVGLARTPLMIYTKFFHDPELPIGKRGWDTKDKLIHGIDKAMEMVAAAQRAIENCDKLLADQSADKDKVKVLGRITQCITNSIGDMGVGVHHACKKIVSGFFGRMFWGNIK